MRAFLAGWAILCVTTAAAQTAGDWPNWRGANLDGISAEAGWSAQWPKEGPKKLWSAKVGEGYSAVAVSGGKVYTMGNVGGKDTVWCFDAASGAEVWKHAYDCPSARQYPGTRATPCVNGGKVYTLSRQGQLYCFEAAKGTVLWNKDVPKEAGGASPKWGYAGSAQIFGNMVVVNVGSHGTALNKDTGAIVWKTGAGMAGYAPAVPYELGGKQALAIFGNDHLYGVDAASGAKLWQHEWKTNYGVNSIDPVFFGGDKLFITSDYGYGCAVLQLGAGGVKEAWRNKVLSSHCSPVVLLDGHIYGFDGNQNSISGLVCLDVATGAQKWKEASVKGSLMAADGKLVIMTVNGQIRIAEAHPAAYKELASAQVLTQQCWTMPVLAGGRIYGRNTPGDLVCLDVSGK